MSFDIKIAPWHRALSLTEKNDNALIYPISRIPEREKEFIWLLPLHTMKFQLYGRKGKVDVNLNDIDTGQYKFVCANFTILCTGLKKLGVPDKSIVKISDVNDLQMINMVYRERVDFVLITTTGLKHHLKESSLTFDDFVALDNYQFDVVDYIAGNKNFIKSLTDSILKSAEQLSKD